MSLLSLTQDACALVGIDVPTSVLSSTDPTYTQFGYLAQFEGDELSREFKWREQKVAGDFTGDGTTTIWALPDDFDRFTTEMRRESSVLLGLDGPVSDDEFLDAQVRNWNPTIPYFRLFNGNIETVPAVADGQQIRFEYVSSYWITDSMGVAKARFTADSDLSLLPERLVTLGLVTRARSEEDKRRMLLAVTGKGHDCLASAPDMLHRSSGSTCAATCARQLHRVPAMPGFANA